MLEVNHFVELFCGKAEVTKAMWAAWPPESVPTRMVKTLQKSTKAGFVGHGMDLNMDEKQRTFDFLRPAGFLLGAQLLRTCSKHLRLEISADSGWL